MTINHYQHDPPSLTKEKPTAYSIAALLNGVEDCTLLPDDSDIVQQLKSIGAIAVLSNGEDAIVFGATKDEWCVNDEPSHKISWIDGDGETVRVVVNLEFKKRGDELSWKVSPVPFPATFALFSISFHGSTLHQGAVIVPASPRKIASRIREMSAYGISRLDWFIPALNEIGAVAVIPSYDDIVVCGYSVYRWFKPTDSDFVDGRFPFLIDIEDQVLGFYAKRRCDNFFDIYGTGSDKVWRVPMVHRQKSAGTGLIMDVTALLVQGENGGKSNDS